MKFFATLFAVGLAVTGAAAVQVSATATSFAVGASPYCLGANIDPKLVAKAQAAIASGNYAAVAQADVECGSFVFWLNKADSSVSYISIVVDVVPEGSFGLNAAQYDSVSAGEYYFDAIYVVSPPNGRRRR
ncbi:hypothetical protein C8J56DRAFT_1020074 [Mycena floridula]|nr:hypothetical protein C8J56DRAFT_1020074 [Mycena floridula]